MERGDNMLFEEGKKLELPKHVFNNLPRPLQNRTCVISERNEYVTIVVWEEWVISAIQRFSNEIYPKGLSRRG